MTAIKIMKRNKLTQALGLTAVAFGMAGSASAGIMLATDSGWEASLTGSMPVFFVYSDHDEFVNGDNTDETASRIMSGFNPVNLTFHVQAPTTASGLTVSGHVQYDTHLQDSGVQNSGLFESRVAEIQIEGDFGKFNIGKGFGLFNTAAIGDLGSQGGIGHITGPDGANAQNGRIGTGYVYANFNPHITYTSPTIGDILVIKVGIINPEEPQGSGRTIETDLPRFEGQADLALDFGGDNGLKLWAGFLFQNIDVKPAVGATTGDFDYDIQGLDIGGHLDIGIFGLTLSYTDTEGIGADGLYGFAPGSTDAMGRPAGGGVQDAELDATQWYVEADVSFNKTIIGLSYGEGEQDDRTADATKGLVATPDIENELFMLFVHHKLTPSLKLIGEIQQYESDVQAEYDALIFGFQFDF